MKYLFIIIIQIVVITHIFAQQGSLAHNAINKIINYAKDQTNPKPTIKDYTDANVSGITSQNLKDVNQKIIKIQSGERDPAYRDKSNQDYIYDFNHTNAEVITLSLKDLTIDLGENKIFKNTSVFLKIDISTTKLGQYFTPIVSTVYNEEYHEHTLEPGAKGFRYLNISDLHIDENSKIKLGGKFVSLKDQSVELYVFKNPEIKNKKILIIAPHPDDAEIAAYGLYSMYHNSTYIVTITAGDAGPNYIYNNIYKDLKSQFFAKGKKRTLDSITVPLLGGIPYEQCVNLGYFDSKLNTMRSHKSIEIQGAYTKTIDINTFRQYNVSSLLNNLDALSTWNSLVNNLTDLLNKIKPDIIVTPHPKLDRHADHKLSSEALFEALKKSNIQKGKLFLYTNHATESEYYPYGKTEEAITLPPIYGKSIYFNGIYSHALSKSTQNDKIFALEAMSDLRFTPQGSIFQSPCKDKLHLLCKDYSYLRRAARSNELFFIIDIKNML